MIDARQAEHIKQHGAFKDSGEARLKILKEEIGFRLDQPAEYVIIGGCFQPELMTGVFKALKILLDRLEVNYTMLSKEYCCGWMPIGQPAVMTRNDEDIAAFKNLSKDFLMENFKQADALGAKSIALFCGACEPNYSNYKDLFKQEHISYVEMLDRHFKGGELNMEIDYYAGCYRFRRKITNEPIDVSPAERLLKKIKGLKVNYLNNTLCCYKPDQITRILESLNSNNIVNICTGCYHNLKGKVQSDKNVQVKMLPEILVEALA